MIVVVDSVYLTSDLTAFSSPPVNSSTFSYPWLEKRANIDGEALFCVREHQVGMIHHQPDMTPAANGCIYTSQPATFKST